MIKFINEIMMADHAYNKIFPSVISQLHEKLYAESRTRIRSHVSNRSSNQLWRVFISRQSHFFLPGRAIFQRKFA